MASNYSSDLKLELMQTGENAGTWGDNTNNNLNLIQQAIAGFEQVTLSSGGTLALVMTDKAISNARNMVIKFATASIAASTICTIPDSIEKFYIFDATGLTNPANLTIKTASGTGFTLDAAKIYAAYSDGTNLNEISLDTLGGTIGSGGLAANSVLSAAISANQIITAKISDNQITTAKISDNQIVSAKISDLQVTTAKIADDSVTPDKLSNTAVTAGSYTSASITVDAQGRLTAASSGAAAGGAMGEMVVQAGPGSGTYTAHPAANKAKIFAIAGGGGRGGNSQGFGSGGSGGAGGFGYYEVSVTGGDAYPYTIGSGGNSGTDVPNNAPAGNAGNATNVQNLATVNAGGAGNGARRSPPFPGANSGAAGTAPGATLTLNSPEGYLIDSAYGGATEDGYLVILDNHIA